MIYTDLTIKAMNMAYNAHHGQVDRTGVPYIFHPVHVAEQMKDEYSTCVALLHDVLEDTKLTLAEIQAEFPPEIADAVALMTHAPEESYEDYVRRVAGNSLAKLVKIADVAHNSDQGRHEAAHMDTETDARLNRKYARAREILGMN